MLIQLQNTIKNIVQANIYFDKKRKRKKKLAVNCNCEVSIIILNRFKFQISNDCFLPVAVKHIWEQFDTKLLTWGFCNEYDTSNNVDLYLTVQFQGDHRM